MPKPTKKTIDPSLLPFIDDTLGTVWSKRDEPAGRIYQITLLDGE